MKVIILAIALFCFLESAQAISSYQECLNCFYQNRTNFYYCQSNKQCLSSRTRTCAATQMIQRVDQCLEGFQPCTNVTFTQVSVGQIQEYGFGLPPGNGCYIQINRMRNGSYGTMQFNYDDPSILVFDAQEREYKAGTRLGLPLTDDGWGTRRVFVANKGPSAAMFTVRYESGILTTLSTLVVLLSIMLTYF